MRTTKTAERVRDVATIVAATIVVSLSLIATAVGPALIA